MNIVLEPHKMNSVALKLREESEDYYLFFVCMYRTGYTGSKLLGMKSKDLEDFISANTEFLSETFIDELRIHNISKEPNDAFFCNRYSDIPLPRRTIEHWINVTGKELLNIDGFGFKTVTKTFYYEYYRKNDYNFNLLKRLYSSRRQYMADLDAFLDYCGLTVEEYQLDRINSNKSDSSDYLTNLKKILDISISLCSNKSLTSYQKDGIAEVTKEILHLLSPFEDL